MSTRGAPHVPDWLRHASLGGAYPPPHRLGSAGTEVRTTPRTGDTTRTQHQASRPRYAPRVEQPQHLVGIAHHADTPTTRQHRSSNRTLRISYRLSYGTR
jgi:hypothetical protein